MNKYAETSINFFIFITGLVLFHESGNIQTGASMAKGLDLMPKLCAALLTVFGAIMLAKNIATWNRGKSAEQNAEEPRENYRHFFLNLALLALYVALLQSIGFLITTAAYVAIQMYMFSPRQKKHLFLSPLVGVGTSIVVYFTFVNGFQLLLPSGILG